MKIERKITHEDLKFFWNNLEDENQVKEVVNYLKDNHLEITLRHWEDIRGGMHYFLEGEDLSGNGFCFHGSRLLWHVRNYRKNIAIKKSEEYRLYLRLKDKYKDVK